MPLTQLIFLTAIFVLVVGAVMSGVLLLRPSATQRRLRALQQEAGEPGALAAGERWLHWIAGVTKPLSSLAAPAEGFEKSNLKLRFTHAGLRNPVAPSAFFGVKALLTLGQPLLGYTLAAVTSNLPRGNNLLLMLLALAAIGYYLPNLVLSHLVQTRQREIFESFPDALDLMTVCVEAGLGTESALSRVADDMALRSPALSDELRLVNLELRAGADRERALRNLAIRTGVEEVGSFVTMLSQAERFGTSIAASLRVHSDMLRTKRRQRAEEAAAKTGVKMVFPLVFCIFPAIWVVTIGPAAIRFMTVLLPMVDNMKK
jgi:tight adherence protein C